MYQLVYCSQCEECLGHSDCLTPRNREGLLCDGCGSNSCYDNKDGHGRLFSPKVSNSDVIYISSCSDESSGCGSLQSGCGSLQSGRGESDNEWKLAPKNLLNRFNGTRNVPDENRRMFRPSQPAATTELNSCNEFKRPFKTSQNESRLYCDSGSPDNTGPSPRVIVSPGHHGYHDNPGLSMSYAGQCHTQ